MRAVVVIPARYASSRLPGKPLLADTGKPLIQYAVESARAIPGVGRVIVATDDQRIAECVRGFGGEAAMTRADHSTGTDRVAEVAAGLDCDVVVNVQGDEPELGSSAVELLLALMRSPRADMATLAAPIRSRAAHADPNRVKVVTDDAGRALCFSRSPIPFARDAGESGPDYAADPPQFLLHLGVYAYRREFLLRLSALPPHPWEELEKLEQLRALAAGAWIQLGVVAGAHAGIDTPADYAAFVGRQRGRVAGG